MVDVELLLVLVSVVLNTLDQRMVAVIGLIAALTIMMHKKETTMVEFFRSEKPLRTKYKVQQTFEAERYPLEAVRGLCDRDDDCVAIIQIVSIRPDDEGTWYGKVIRVGHETDETTKKHAFDAFIRKLKTEHSRKSLLVDVLIDRWTS
jgi:hypothetical protein